MVNIMTTATKSKQYPIADIVVSTEFTVRANGVDDYYVERYREAIDYLPPIVLFDVDGHLVLVDGFHRLEAFKREGREDIPAEVHKGTKDEALAYSAWCNAKHGRPLVNAEVRNAAARLFGLGYDEQQVADLLGKTKVWTSRLKCGYEVKAGINLTYVPRDSFLEILYPAGEAMWMPLAKLTMDRNWSYDDLQSMVKRVSEEGDTKRLVVDVFKGKMPATTPITAKEVLAAERERAAREAEEAAAKAMEAQAAAQAAAQQDVDVSNTIAAVNAAQDPKATAPAPTAPATPAPPATSGGYAAYPTTASRPNPAPAMERDDQDEGISDEHIYEAVDQLLTIFDWMADNGVTYQQVAMVLATTTSPADHDELEQQIRGYRDFLVNTSDYLALVIHPELNDAAREAAEQSQEEPEAPQDEAEDTEAPSVELTVNADGEVTSAKLAEQEQTEAESQAESKSKSRKGGKK